MPDSNASDNNQARTFLSRKVFLVMHRDGLAMPVMPGFGRRLGLPKLIALHRLAAGAPPNDTLPYEVAKETGFLVAVKGLLKEFEDMHAVGALLPEAQPLLRAPPPDDPGEPQATLAADAKPELELPFILRVTADGFQMADHNGATIALLNAAETFALNAFVSPRTREQAFAVHQENAGRAGLSRTAFDALAQRLYARGLLYDTSTSNNTLPSRQGLDETLEKQRGDAHYALKQAVRRQRANADTPGTQRIPVVPITYNDLRPPLALGLILARAKNHDGGKLTDTYDFVADWSMDEEQLRKQAGTRSVFLFSNYMWSHQDCLAASRLVKEVNPDCITIHGGPNTPKYPGDVEQYFLDYPHVDITVRGEGEVTVTEILEALRPGIKAEPVDLSVLRDVPGLSFRQGNEVVQTAMRPQIQDLDSLPSPYLSGLFDAYREATPEFAVIETNRGCPYGCTFCDWGSATMSRIRAFNLERVFAELEWCAQNRIPTINVADANFGIWERDVVIAQKVVELRHRYGYPKMFAVNFAKNKVKYLKQIIQMMIDAGIMTSGVLSLQSMDQDTLKAIDRANIRTDKYDELATQFRKAGLPLHVDIMVGLPGQTVTSFLNDLQECIDREVAVNLAPTQLLTNSPMNEPSYRARYQIKRLNAKGLVIATSTFTEQERDYMGEVRRAFELFDNFGVLRQVSRWVRQETGVREIDFYTALKQQAECEPERWPTINFTLKVVPRLLLPPGSWHWFIEEIRTYLTDVLGLPEDSAMRTVLSVQHALLPARHREFPLTLELEHDYTAWHRAVLNAKDEGQRADWPTQVARLQSFAPGRFSVDDTRGVTDLGLGLSSDAYAVGLSWELDTPIARPSNFGSELVESRILNFSRAAKPRPARASRGGGAEPTIAKNQPS